MAVARHQCCRRTVLAAPSGHRSDEAIKVNPSSSAEGGSNSGLCVAAVQSPELPARRILEGQLLILGSEDAPSCKNQIKRRANTQIDRFHGGSR